MHLQINELIIANGPLNNLKTSTMFMYICINIQNLREPSISF